MVSLGISVHRIVASADGNGFTSFRLCIPFFFFSSLIVMARTSKITLDNNDKRGHPCPCTDLRGNAFRFSLLRIMFAMN